MLRGRSARADLLRKPSLPFPGEFSSPRKGYAYAGSLRRSMEYPSCLLSFFSTHLWRARGKIVKYLVKSQPKFVKT